MTTHLLETFHTSPSIKRSHLSGRFLFMVTDGTGTLTSATLKIDNVEYNLNGIDGKGFATALEAINFLESVLPSTAVLDSICMVKVF